MVEWSGHMMLLSLIEKWKRTGVIETFFSFSFSRSFLCSVGDNEPTPLGTRESSALLIFPPLIIIV